MTNWKKLDFLVPIEESVRNDEGFKIKGVAINVTTTRNGTTFTEEELKKSANSLKNKPILKDHTNSVDAIVGRTTDNVKFNVENQNLEFEAIIKDEHMKELINDGRISSVSVGATVQTFEDVRNEDGEIVSSIAKGIDFLELSLVAVPADPNAGFAKAIMESFELYKQENKNKLEENKMVEEVKESLETLQAQEAVLKEELAQMRIEKLKEEKSKLMVKEEAEVEEPATEEPASEEPAVKVEDKTEGEVSTEPEADVAEEKYTITSSEMGGLSVSADYSSLNLKKFER